MLWGSICGFWVKAFQAGGTVASGKNLSGAESALGALGQQGGQCSWSSLHEGESDGPDLIGLCRSSHAAGGTWGFNQGEIGRR